MTITGQPIMPDQTAIFWRLKRLRQARKMTLEDVSKKTGLTKSFLSKLERGLSVPSIASVLKLAQAYDMAVGDLIGENSSASSVSIVRRADRKPFEGPGSSNSRHEAITSMLGDGIIEAFILRPPVEDGKLVREEPSEHGGQELIFILRGKIEVSWPQKKEILKVGDTATFDAQLPHKCRSVGPGISEALVVVARPPRE